MMWVCDEIIGRFLLVIMSICAVIIVIAIASIDDIGIAVRAIT